MFEPMQKRFHFGDLVRMHEDEGDTIYRVTGYTVSVHFETNMVGRELVYDLEDAHTGDYIPYPAYDDELTLVVHAEDADDFLANSQRQEESEQQTVIVVDAFDAELIDYYLDRYNEHLWAYKQLRKVAPEIAKEFKKDAKLTILELKELTGGGADA